MKRKINIVLRCKYFYRLQAVVNIHCLTFLILSTLLMDGINCRVSVEENLFHYTIKTKVIVKSEVVQSDEVDDRGGRVKCTNTPN